MQIHTTLAFLLLSFLGVRLSNWICNDNSIMSACVDFWSSSNVSLSTLKSASGEHEFGRCVRTARHIRQKDGTLCLLACHHDIASKGSSLRPGSAAVGLATTRTLLYIPCTIDSRWIGTTTDDQGRRPTTTGRGPQSQMVIASCSSRVKYT